MKIAFFVDEFPVLSQTFVLNQITGLIDLGIDVSILSLSRGDETLNLHQDYRRYHLAQRTIYLHDENPSVFGKLSARLWGIAKGLLQADKRSAVLRALRVKHYGHQAKSLLLAAVVAKLPRALHFDVILAHFAFNGVMANQLRDLGGLTGGIATIVHGNEISCHQALAQYQMQYRKLFSQTECLLPISQLWLQRLVELGCAKEKIFVHRMGIDLVRFQFMKNKRVDDCHSIIAPVTEKPLQLFTVARFTEKKGLRYALAAIARIKDSLDLHYRLAGYGELLPEIEQLILELGLSEQVTLLGPIGQQQVQQELNAADVLLQPSVTAADGDMEGIPVTLMEAMASGTLVVSTYHSGIPELLTHEEHGLLSPEKDVDALADNLLRVKQAPEQMAKIRTNARQRIEKLGDIDILNRQLLAKLQQLTQSIE